MDRVVSLPGVVYSLGHEADIAAELYAALTGRPVRICEDPSKITVAAHDVVVCTTKYLTAHLMHRLYVECSREGVPGLMCSATPAELEDLCRQQAFKFSRPLLERPRRVFVNSLLQIKEEVRDTDVFTGGLENFARLTDRLSSNISVLAVTGQTSSFDISLTLRQFACAFLHPPIQGTEGQPLPTCQVLGRCTMFPTRPLIDEARQKGWLVPLSLLRSEIGIFCSCSLVRIQEGFFEPAYSLGPALLRHADFGAIITTWRTERSLEKGTHLYSLVNDLSAGIPPGVAVQTYNRSIFAKRFGINLCLLGDPAFRVSRHEATPKLPVPQLDAFGANSTATNRRDNTIGSEIKLLRAAIGATSSGKLFDPIQGRALADALLPYEEFTVPIHEIPDGRFSTLDSALLDFLSAAPMPGPFLGRFMRTDPVNEESVCPWCNSPARSYRATFPEFGASARNVVLCPSCFDSCNLPDGWDISVALEQLPMGGVVSVFGAPEGSQILVSFRGLEITNDYGFVRLIVTDGSVSVRIPENLPLLPLYCHVLIIHNLQLGAVGFAFMSEQHSELNSERSLPGCTNIQEESMTATHLQAKDT